MFWNKKEETFRTLFKLSDGFFAHREKSYPGYKDDAMKTAKRLAFYEDLQELDVKLDLILSHLKLKYVPGTETKEPAKLIENTTYLGIDWGTMEGDKGSNCTWTGSGWIITPPVKKRGRPKKK